MRYAWGLRRLAAAAGLCWMATGPAAAQLSASDWPLHRGTEERVGANSAGLFAGDVRQVYLWPNTRDLRAEIVVDDAPPSGRTYPLSTGQRFDATGTWTAAPTGTDRSPGAWPSIDDRAAQRGGYQYTDAVKSADLATLGVTLLSKLPNLGVDTDDANAYKIVNDTLNAASVYARWSFGTAYPLGTRQGLREVAFDASVTGAFRQPLERGQRYAVYIRWPSTGTRVGGVMRPNADNVLVRVSWGADPNDAAKSRIFLVNMGQTGGFWARLRTGAGDDRAFPYDGVNPITVTLYALTPDAIDNPADYPVKPIVVADAVRLVPETLRGDIHAPAASALLSSGAAATRLTYFGRDETVGPLRLIQDAALLAELKAQYKARRQLPAAPFAPVLFDPTKAPDADPDHADFNPILPDPTSSIRSGVFYCLQDDAPLSRYGQLRWRYTANTAPVVTASGGTTVALPTLTVDDNAVAPAFTHTGFSEPALAAGPTEQAFGPTVRLAQTVAYGSATIPQATWTATLPVKGYAMPSSGTPTADHWTGQTYTVMAWISSRPNLAHYAHYRIDTLYGPQDAYVDQRMSADGQPLVGGWRVIATHVRFPFVGANQVGVVHLLADAPHETDATLLERDDVGHSRNVVADAVQFVPESLTPASVLAAPQISIDRKATGTAPTARTTVRFATDEGTAGHVWTLDAFGVDLIGAAATSSLTTALWVYPSLRPLSSDPNYETAPAVNAIDGELRTVGGATTVVNAMPAVLGFRSSPVYLEQGAAGSTRSQDFRSFVLLGNQNGRLYGFDPMGRGDHALASGDAPGTPGTTERVLTWPSAGRDRYRVAGGATPFSAYPDDADKEFISAAPSVRTQDAFRLSDLVIVGAGDGHVYAFDPAKINVTSGGKPTRGYNATSQSTPLWQYPNKRTALDPITHTGALATSASGQYIFPAGGRVYGIDTGSPDSAGTVKLRWAYPYANPESPASGDKPALDLPFTSPAWQPVVSGLNDSKEVVFIAERGGLVHALDASRGAATPSATVDLWTDQTALGPTRSSPVFLSRLQSNVASRPTGPALLMPFDNGLLFGIVAASGARNWQYSDGTVGGVPATDANGNAVAVATSYVFRGTDAITANGFVYNGDEGLQDTGEVNGQLHAYGDVTLTGGGSFVPGEPGNRGAGPNDLFDFRGANLVTDPTYTAVTGGTMSGESAITGSNAYPDNAPGTAVYEWGDTIQAVAWGVYADGAFPPTSVEFRITGRGATRNITVQPRADTVNTGPHTLVLPSGDTVPADAWVAVASIPLGQPSESDPQTPGSQYRIAIQVNGTTGQPLTFWETGQRVDQNGNLVAGSESRSISLAHPLALSTSGAPSADALNSPNKIGYVHDVATANAFTELLGNGNLRVANVSNQTQSQDRRDLYAPIGAVQHGGSATYTGLNGGVRVPALFIVDRSNLGPKMNQRIRNVRVDRNDLAWGWDPTNAAQQPTGNVMNPLPWETFPNTVPNVSRDYPDVDRGRVAMKAAGADMALTGAALAPRPALGQFAPTALDLSVSVPRYQPANVSPVYVDANGTRLRNGTDEYGYAPMQVPSGQTTTTGPALFPSAGYVGGVRVFVGVANRETFDQRFAYREMRIGIAVPPDIALRTVEEVVDLGVAPHSLGYAPIVAGSTQNTPFMASGAGPYNGGISPFDPANVANGQTTPYPNSASFFAPVTVISDSNVNLVNPRIAKVIGNRGTSVSDPQFWLRLSAEDVENRTGVGQIYGVPSNPLSATIPGATGFLGLASTLDHRAGGMTLLPTAQYEIDYQLRYGLPNLWPRANAYVPNVPAGSLLAMQGWAAGVQPRPTVHKPRPGDPNGSVMTTPDVAYGDPLNALAISPDLRPRVGVPVPLGTPAGTYSAPISVFEDAFPPQWRAWVRLYQSRNGGGAGPMDVATDDDGVLNVNQPQAASPVPVESTTRTPFRLRITVREARLTNTMMRELAPPSGGSPPQAARVQPDGSYLQAEARAWQQKPLGANLQPAVWRSPDLSNGGIIAYWTTNRLPFVAPVGGDPWAAPLIQDTPWLLTGSRLRAAIATVRFVGTVFDWQFADATRWWRTPSVLQPGALPELFPSDPTGVADAPVPVAGAPLARSVRFTSPSIVADAAGVPWLWWQGQVTKSGGAGTQLDTRTFYQQLDPLTGQAVGDPVSFLNDPAMPKFAPKPLVAKTGGAGIAYLFWYGGPTGRSRLYYNAKNLVAVPLGSAVGWSADAALPTPGALQWQADPVPVYRNAYVADDSGAETPIQAIDLVYSGALKNRGQSETLLTRYSIDQSTGTLNVARLPRVDNELLVRDGARQTWMAPDLAWVFQIGGAYVSAATPVHGIVISVVRADGTVVSPANIGEPTYDSATSRLYYSSALGGQLFVEPQNGTVTFPDVAPSRTDRVVASYTPRAQRLNVARNPAAGIAFVATTGANSGPAAFLDRMPNPRSEAIYPSFNAGNPPAVTRLWLLYRKSGAGDAGSGALYYKTMRLVVQLPSPVRANLVNGAYTGVPNVTVTSAGRALGAVEVDWVRGRLYFTEQDEGNLVNVAYTDQSGNAVGSTRYRVRWADEMAAGVQASGQSAGEALLPTMTSVNEGQVAAFKDPFQDKVWVFWSSTRAGVSDIYYETISPRFYPEPRLP